MLTQEQIFATFAVSMASANGKLGKAEIQNIYTVAKACKIDFDKAMEACRKELVDSADIKEMVKEMTPSDKKFAIDLSIQISVASGAFTLKELQLVHYYAEDLGMAKSSYVTTAYLRQLRNNPSLSYDSE